MRAARSTLGVVGLFAALVTAGCGGEPEVEVLEEPAWTPRVVDAAEPPVEDAPWEPLSLDLSSDGVLWASSWRALYRSEDLGASWQAVVAWWPPAWVDAWAAPDGSSVYVECWHSRALWDRATDTVARIEGLEPAGLSVEFRRGAVWLARGYYETGAAAERPHSSSGPSLAVAGVIGCTACSLDAGRTWTLVDAYDGAAVADLFLEDDDTLHLLLSELGVRSGALRTTGAGAPSAELTTLHASRALVPLSTPLEYSFLWEWIFVQGERGWIGARTHHGSDGVLLETTTGGTSWELHVLDETPRTAVFRLGDGRWLKHQYTWGEPDVYLQWADGAFTDFPALPTQGGSSARRVEVAATGDLLVLLEDGELWLYELAGDAWRRLWERPSGGAALPGR
ncbi:MAG: hypothetical protein H6828_08060 [Planctomycetes bacterium]|nr:hypothetical protein [Planctomycetota bacterium]